MNIRKKGCQFFLFTLLLTQFLIFPIIFLRLNNSEQVNGFMEGNHVFFTINPEPKIVETKTTEYPRYGLYSMNWDGSNYTKIFGSDDFFINGGIMSPNETKIVFMTYRDIDGDGIIDADNMSAAEIGIMNVDGTNVTLLTNDTYLDAIPSWSANGSKILWTTMRFSGNNLDIAVMDADGSNVMQLTNSPEHESDPAWVNDKVVYTRNYSIWMMYENGSNQKQVTFPPNQSQDHPVSAVWNYGDYDPDLSPDESKITFERLVNDSYEEFDLYVDTIDSNWDVTGEQDLSKNNWSEGLPEFSPDGENIIFWISACPDNFTEATLYAGEIFMINTSGANRVNVKPDWTPIHPVLESIFMRENPDWFPSATWAIDGEPDILFGGEFHGEWIPPIFLSTPLGGVFIKGMTGNVVTWIPLDTDPANYSINVDGNLYINDTWNGGAINMTLDFLALGDHVIYLTIRDLAGFNTSSMIRVTVFPLELLLIISSTEQKTFWDNYGFFIVVGGAIACIVIIWKRKKRR